MEIKFKGCQKLQLGEKTFLALELQSYEEIRQANEICDKINPVNALHVAEIKRHREKRSISSNSYCWLLTDKLANTLSNADIVYTKEQIHTEMIIKYGQKYYDDDGKVVKVSVPIPPNKIADIVPYCKHLGESQLNGLTYHHYIVYRGSSTYNTEEMSVFIKGIVLECQEVGIETKSPNEIAKMLNLMEQER